MKTVKQGHVYVATQRRGRATLVGLGPTRSAAVKALLTLL